MFGEGFGGFFGGLGSTYNPWQENGFQRIGDFFNRPSAPPVAEANAPVMTPGIGSAVQPPQPIATNTVNQQAAANMGFGGDSREMMMAVSADQKGMGLLPMFSQPGQAPSASAVPPPQARPAPTDYGWGNSDPFGGTQTATAKTTPVATAPLPPATTTAADGSKWGDYSQPQWPASGKGADLSGAYAQPGTFSDRFDAVAGNVQSPTTALAPQAAQPAVTADQSPAPMPKPQASAVDSMLPAPLWQQQPGIGQAAPGTVGSQINGSGTARVFASPDDQAMLRGVGNGPNGLTADEANKVYDAYKRVGGGTDVSASAYANDPSSAARPAGQGNLFERIGDKVASWIGPSSAQASEAPVDSIIDSEAKRAGMDPNTVRAFVNIESGGNPNAATGSYKGLLQLSNQEFKENGGQGNILDPQQNLRAGITNLKEMSGRFEQQFGRPPTPTELYLMHQQGEAGARAQLANPDKPAWQNMFSTGEGQQKGAAWAKKAIWGNIPDSAKKQFGSVENVTGRDFVNLWDARLKRGMGQTMMAKNAPATQPAQVASASTPQTGPAAAKAWQPPDLGLTKVASATPSAHPQSQPGIGYRTNPGFAMAQTFAKAAQNVQKAPAIPQGQRAQAPQYDAARDPVLAALNAQGARYLPMPVAS